MDKILGIKFIDSKPKVRRRRIGSQITHDDELDYAPIGIGKNSYVVLPELEKLTRITGFASVAVVDESGFIIKWVMRDVVEDQAMEYIKKHGKPKDWDPDDECDD